MKTILLAGMILLLPPCGRLLAQAPPILWQHCYGGDSTDYINCIRQTLDGGFIALGYTRSADGDLAGNGGVKGLWVLKLDDMGNIQWSQTYSDIPYSERAIEQSADSGYIIAGYPTVKLSPDGREEWTRNLFTTNAHATADGGFITCYPYTPAHVTKLNADGSTSWQNLGLTTGGYGVLVYDICPVETGGYMVSGWSYDIYASPVVVRVNDTAGPVSYVAYDAGHGSGYNICATTDGNYLSTGVMTGLLNTLGKYNDSATQLWNEGLAGLGQYSPQSLAAASWGGGLLAGSDTGVISKLEMAAFDTGGHVMWQAKAGGTRGDAANSCLQSRQGPFIAAGYTNSNDGDVSGNHGGQDAWIVAFGSYTGVSQVSKASPNIKVYPVPAGQELYVDLPVGGENDQLQVLEVSGRVLPVAEESQGLHRILKLSGVAAGTYLVRITGSSGVTSRMFTHF